MGQHLVILDLDETLVYGAERPLDRIHDFQVGPYLVDKRPFLTEFLFTVFEWFEVAVWSTGWSRNSSAIPKHCVSFGRGIAARSSLTRRNWTTTGSKTSRRSSVWASPWNA